MHEAITLDTYYHENIEARVRSLMAIAKGQLDYKALHNEYKLIRNDSVSNVPSYLIQVPDQRTDQPPKSYHQQSTECP